METSIRGCYLVQVSSIFANYTNENLQITYQIGASACPSTTLWRRYVFVCVMWPIPCYPN